MQGYSIPSNYRSCMMVMDIELPDKDKTSPAYIGFKELGFEIPYTRYHYRLNK
jgi:hypothetical protein